MNAYTNHMQQKQPAINESRYRGKWIALDPKTYRVVSHSTSLKKAEENARKKGINHPLMHSVPKSDAVFIG